MPFSLPAWLQPPRFEDPAVEQQAAVVWMCMLLGLGVCVLQAITYVFVPTMAASWPALIPEVGGMLAVLVALRRGHVVVPTALLVVALAAVGTAYVFFGGGLEMGFPPLLGTMAVLGALAMGPRVGGFLTLWAVGVTTAVLITGSNEMLLIEGQDRRAILFTVQVITIALGGGLVTYSTHRLHTALQAEREQTRLSERTADELLQARRYTSDIVQTMAEGVLVVRLDGTIRRVNDAAVRLLGAGSNEAVVGESIERFLSSEALEELDRAATPGATAIGEARVQTFEGSVPVRVARSPVMAEDGTPEQVFVLADIRHLVEARQRSEAAAIAAEAANRAKSQFLANMSHELRTPLNAVIGYSDMLLDDIEDQEQVQDLQRIRSAGRHLLSLINDVLDMSKIEAGRMEVYLEPVRIASIVEEVLDGVRPAADERGNSLAAVVPDAVDLVRTDARKLRQILTNLVSNAVKFTENGAVEVEVELDHHQLRVHVRDTGIGIADDQLDQLFQPFVQADDSTSRRYGGTGLGLALSRRFAEMLGGHLLAVSELGQGSTFTLRLPLLIGPTSTPAPEVDPGSAPVVLCVDDDPPTLDLLARILRRQGLRVATASTGLDALELARRHHPAVITLDVMMPEMDGWTLLGRLREDPQLRDVPVVMVSMVDQDHAEALALGASDYLVKPVAPDDLLATVGRYLTAQTGQVLVVDDEPDIRELLRRLLVGEGWTVVTAENSRVALEKMEGFTPDLVLLDLMMPEMDGFAFVEHVRAHDAWRDLPIVVLTAMDLNSDQWERLSRQTSQVVAKQGAGLQQVLRAVRRFATPTSGSTPGS